jgi:hypothetical protein
MKFDLPNEAFSEVRSRAMIRTSIHYYLMLAIAAPGLCCCVPIHFVKGQSCSGSEPPGDIPIHDAPHHGCRGCHRRDTSLPQNSKPPRPVDETDCPWAHHVTILAERLPLEIDNTRQWIGHFNLLWLGEFAPPFLSVSAAARTIYLAGPEGGVFSWLESGRDILRARCVLLI